MEEWVCERKFPIFFKYVVSILFEQCICCLKIDTLEVLRLFFWGGLFEKKCHRKSCTWYKHSKICSRPLLQIKISYFGLEYLNFIEKQTGRRSEKQPPFTACVLCGLGECAAEFAAGYAAQYAATFS